MSEFMMTYWYIGIFVSFISGVATGRLIERDSSKGEDCSRAEDDAGY